MSRLLRPPGRVPAAVVLLVVAFVLGACSTGPTDERDASTRSTVDPEAGAYPVTIRDAFGETTIDRQPRRVATLGWSDQDVVLALGVVPVGATKITWGGNAAGSTPWFDARLDQLGGAEPVRYDDSDGVPFEQVAALRPDLILATSSGLTAAEHRKLEEIAPVVAYPGEPWQTPWQTSVRMVGQALGLPGAAEQLVATTERDIAEARTRYPVLVGKTFIFGALTPTDLSKVDYYLPGDNRPRVLTELGMRNAPVIERLARKTKAFYGTISAERAAELDSDVFITYAENRGDLARFEKSPLLSRIPAFRTGAVLASVDKTASLGLSSPSPLSLPWAMEHFVPGLAAVAAKAR